MKLMLVKVAKKLVEDAFKDPNFRFNCLLKTPLPPDAYIHQATVRDEQLIFQIWSRTFGDVKELALIPTFPMRFEAATDNLHYGSVWKCGYKECPQHHVLCLFCDLVWAAPNFETAEAGFHKHMVEEHNKEPRWRDNPEGGREYY